MFLAAIYFRSVCIFLLNTSTNLSLIPLLLAALCLGSVGGGLKKKNKFLKISFYTVTISNLCLKGTAVVFFKGRCPRMHLRLPPLKLPSKSACFHGVTFNKDQKIYILFFAPSLWKKKEKGRKKNLSVSASPQQSVWCCAIFGYNRVMNIWPVR